MPPIPDVGCSCSYVAPAGSAGVLALMPLLLLIARRRQGWVLGAQSRSHQY
ncbi:MAG TPA: hypothetical protein DIU15_11785 [Deltaproteobacteria bacterium]|nr:hypothetical protein [Deltaproteobacteria bacterium]